MKPVKFRFENNEWLPTEPINEKFFYLNLGDKSFSLVYDRGILTTTPEYFYKHIKGSPCFTGKEYGKIIQLFGDSETHYTFYYEQKLQDTGDRTEFNTGAVRDMPEGKGRYDLIPYEPLRRLALHYEYALKKYTERNWEKGLPIKSYLDSAERHLEKLKEGMKDEDHAAAVIWNMAALIFTFDEIQKGNLPKELADGLRPKLKDWING